MHEYSLPRKSTRRSPYTNTIRLFLTALLLIIPFLKNQAFAQATDTPHTTQDVLKSPLNISHPLLVGTVANTTCAKPEPAVSGIRGVPYYTDRKHSVIDPKRRKADFLASEALRKFSQSVSQQVEIFEYSQGHNVGAAQCALAKLDTWASANALQGYFNAQGAHHRKWALTSIAISFLMISEVPQLDQVKLQNVSRWLDRLGKLVQTPYLDGKLENNHLYWAATAAIVAGVAANDRELFNWGAKATRFGIDSIQSDGTLKRELERGSRAFGYHVFSLTALEMSAAFMQANHLCPYQQNRNGLDRLADYVLKKIEKDIQSGARISDSNIPWMEIHYTYTHDKRLEPFLKQDRPIHHPFFGNVTMLLGTTLDTDDKAKPSTRQSVVCYSQPKMSPIN